MARRLESVQSREVINISQQLLTSSPRGPRASRAEDSCNGGRLVQTPASQQADDELYRVTPEYQSHRIPLTRSIRAENSALGHDSHAQPSHAAPSSKRTPSSLRRVAEHALASAETALPETSVPATSQAPARTSSNASRESRQSAEAPSAASQTTFVPTSALKPAVAKSAMAGTRAADLLRARRGQADGVLSQPPVPTEDGGAPTGGTARKPGAPVMTTKSHRASKSKLAMDAASARPPMQSGNTGSQTATPAPASRSAKMDHVAVSRPGTPALSRRPARPTLRGRMQAQTSPAASNPQKAGKRRPTIEANSNHAKGAHGLLHLGEEGDAGSNYDIPHSSPKARTRAMGRNEARRQPAQGVALPIAESASIVAVGKLPKLSSSQFQKAAAEDKNATKKSASQMILSKKVTTSSELEPAKYSRPDPFSDDDAVMNAAQEQSFRSEEHVSAAKQESRGDSQPSKHGRHRPATTADGARGSQHDPHVISDSEESSSVMSEPAEPNPKDVEFKGVLPKTPTAWRSSPPTLTKRVSDGQAGSEHPTARAHKTTIVAFDRSGPRNQGKLPVNTPGARSARSSLPRTYGRRQRSKTPGSQHKFGKLSSKDSPSMATSVRTTRERPPPEQSNTAANVGDALESYFGRRVNTVSQNDGGKMRQLSQLSRNQDNPSAEDHRDPPNEGGLEHGRQADEVTFTNIDEFEDPGSPFLQSKTMPRLAQVTGSNRGTQSRERNEKLGDETPLAVHHHNAPTNPPKMTKQTALPLTANPKSNNNDSHTRVSRTHQKQEVETLVGGINHENAASRFSLKPDTVDLHKAEKANAPTKTQEVRISEEISEKSADCFGDGTIVTAPKAALELEGRSGKQELVAAEHQSQHSPPRANSPHKVDNKARPPQDTSRTPRRREQPKVHDSRPVGDSSKKKMPPPPRRKKAPNAVTTVQVSGPPAIERTAASTRPKRGVAADISVAQASKRVRMESQVESSESDAYETRPQKMKLLRKRTIAQVEPEEGSASQRVARKTSCQASQGSQTVDVHGSPVPRDMEVEESKTVLETFSQRVAVSSDSPHGRLHMRTEHREHSNLSEEEDCPPSHQQKILSSNTKPVPAEPDAESTAFSRVKVTKQELDLLYGKVHTTRLVDDPFEDPEEQSQIDGGSPDDGGLTSTDLIKKIDALAKQYRAAKQQKTKPPSPELIRMVVQQQPSRPETKQTSPTLRKSQAGFMKTTHPVFSSASTKKVGRSTEQFLACTAARNGEERDDEEDPDKTLVNDEDSTAEADLSNSPRHAAIDPVSQVDSEDLVEWSGLLKPHQRSLFDELVKCAQSFTIDMVRQENATDQMLEDYHRRNMHLIYQEEKRHAKYYQDMLVIRKQKSQERKARLVALKKNFSNLIEDYREHLKEHEAKKSAWQACNRELEKYIAGLV